MEWNANFQLINLCGILNQLEKTTKKQLSLKLSLVNVYSTFRVQSKTKFDIVSLRHYERYQELEQLMREYKISLITSALTLPLKGIGRKKAYFPRNLIDFIKYDPNF